MSNNLSTIASLGYRGTNAANPPCVYVYKKDPTSANVKNFVIGAYWVNTIEKKLWMLVNLEEGVATWQLLNNGSQELFSLSDQNNIAVTPTNGTINVVGTGAITVAGNPGTSTLTASVSGSVLKTITTNSGTATTSGNSLAIQGSGVLTTTASGNDVNLQLTNATDGQLIIGSSTGSPTWANLTAGANISIVNSANSITISQAGAGTQAWNLIASGGNNPLIFNSGITSAYQTLVFFGYIQQGSSVSSLSSLVLLNLSSDGGTTYYNANYQSYITAYNRLNSGIYYNSVSTSSLIAGFVSDGLLVEKGGFTVYIYNIQGNSYVSCQSVGAYSTEAAFASGPYRSGGVYTGPLTGPINALKFTVTNPSVAQPPVVVGSLFGLSL